MTTGGGSAGIPGIRRSQCEWLGATVGRNSREPRRRHSTPAAARPGPGSGDRSQAGRAGGLLAGGLRIGKGPHVPAWRTSRRPAAASEASRRGSGRQLPVKSPHRHHSCQQRARRKAQEARNSGQGYPRTSAIGCLAPGARGPTGVRDGGSRGGAAGQYRARLLSDRLIPRLFPCPSSRKPTLPNSTEASARGTTHHRAC